MAASVLAKVAQYTYSFPFRISKFHNYLVRTPQEYMSFRLLTMFLRKLLNQNYSGKSTNLTKKVIKCFDESKFAVFESKHHAWFYWKEHNILMVKIAPVLLF